MKVIGIVVVMIGVFVLLNAIIHAVFLKKQKEFFKQFENVTLTRIYHVKTCIQQMDAGFRYLRCDIVIAEQTIFLLLKNTIGNITLQQQSIIQLNRKLDTKARYKEVGMALVADSFKTEGDFLSIDSGGLSPMTIELQFKKGFDVAKILRDHNIKIDYE